MKTSQRPIYFFRPERQRGSVLVTVLIFAMVFAITLTSYVQLSTQSLKFAQRSSLSTQAINLTEAGLEEAVWSFNRMGNSTVPSVIQDAWNGWTVTNKVADVYMENMGIGYTSTPTVTFSGGGGSGATGVARVETSYRENGTILRQRVAGITVTNPGSGYTTVPTVTITGGGGTGASAVARFAATRTFTFNNLDYGASGTVKVWVGGYDGATALPLAVAKATISVPNSSPIEKTVKIILSKNGILPKGLVAFNGINWNGHPFADSFLSSATPGVPPFVPYDDPLARANTTVASVAGDIDLAHGTVSGNVLTGPGVTVTGGRITGQTIGNFAYDFQMSTPPVGSYTTLTTIPPVLPRPEERNAANVVIRNADAAQLGPDGKLYYYYRVSNAEIGAVEITAGKNVVIVGDNNTRMKSGLQIKVSGTQVGSATIYMDGPITLSGNDAVNTQSWAGALQIFTTTSQPCTFSGNAKFYGCLTAPNSELTGNGGGRDNADLCGSFVVKSVTSNGHMSFHYDEGLRILTNPRAWRLALWSELQTAADRGAYAEQLNF